MEKKTKILATVGPSSDSVEILEGLIRAGVNVFRLNFSHGTHEYHSQTFKNIKEAERIVGRRVGILQDLCGPKIRVGKLKYDFELRQDDLIEFHTSAIEGEKIGEGRYKLSINQPQILKLLKVGELIYLYDGNIQTKVVETNGDFITAQVHNFGKLSSNKGVNFPNTRINIDAVSEKDKNDLIWGVKHQVDFIAISFVQRKEDVLHARELLKQHGGNAHIFAKIEKFDAVESIDDILEVSDGLMVARGDLGIEVPYYKVPSIQKSIIQKANAASKPIITATQMLLSMTEKETATRAEISDVANAVLDGTDAVMLSEESAIGKNPIHVVETMSNTIKEAEKIYRYNKFADFAFLDETDVIASSTGRLAERLDVRAIISITGSGKSAKKMARYRIKNDIYAVCHDERVARSLTIAWGIEPILVIEKSTLNGMLSSTFTNALKMGWIDKEHTYILTAGYPAGLEGSTNFIRIVKKSEIDYLAALEA
ncbi:MAG: pyruvate kinase [Campylobacteraceae bacterium]|jgi:pyruvate kinase|nr:pyruvate kinase [Campylobacteraceae bacterium]